MINKNKEVEKLLNQEVKQEAPHQLPKDGAPLENATPPVTTGRKRRNSPFPIVSMRAFRTKKGETASGQKTEQVKEPVAGQKTEQVKEPVAGQKTEQAKELQTGQVQGVRRKQELQNPEKQSEEEKRENQIKFIRKYEKTGNYADYGIAYDLKKTRAYPTDSPRMLTVRQALKEYLEVKQKVDASEKAVYGVDDTLGAELRSKYKNLETAINNYTSGRFVLFKWGRGKARLKQVKKLRDRMKEDYKSYPVLKKKQKDREKAMLKRVKGKEVPDFLKDIVKKYEPKKAASKNARVEKLANAAKAANAAKQIQTVKPASGAREYQRAKAQILQNNLKNNRLKGLNSTLAGIDLAKARNQKQKTGAAVVVQFRRNVKKKEKNGNQVTLDSILSAKQREEYDEIIGKIKKIREEYPEYTAPDQLDLISIEKRKLLPDAGRYYNSKGDPYDYVMQAMPADRKRKYEFLDKLHKAYVKYDTFTQKMYNIAEVKERVDTTAPIQISNLETYKYESQTGANCWCCTAAGMMNQMAEVDEWPEYERVNQYDVRHFDPGFYTVEEFTAMGQDKSSYRDNLRDKRNFIGPDGWDFGNIIDDADVFLSKNKNIAVRRMEFVLPSPEHPNYAIIKRNVMLALKEKLAEILETENVVGFLKPGHYTTIVGINAKGEILKRDSGLNPNIDIPISLESMFSNKKVEITWLEKLKTPEELKEEFENLDYDEQQGFHLKKGTVISTEVNVAHRLGVLIPKTESDKMRGKEPLDVSRYITENIYVPTKNTVLQSAENLPKEQKFDDKEYEAELRKQIVLNAVETGKKLYRNNKSNEKGQPVNKSYMSTEKAELEKEQEKNYNTFLKKNDRTEKNKAEAHRMLQEYARGSVKAQDKLTAGKYRAFKNHTVFVGMSMAEAMKFINMKPEVPKEKNADEKTQNQKIDYEKELTGHTVDLNTKMPLINNYSGFTGSLFVNQQIDQAEVCVIVSVMHNTNAAYLPGFEKKKGDGKKEDLMLIGPNSNFRFLKLEKNEDPAGKPRFFLFLETENKPV